MHKYEMAGVGIISDLLSILTLISDVILGLFVLKFILIKDNKTRILPQLWKKIGNATLFFGFLIAFTATLGSLYYSEILKYTPCILCWWQRIFMYSQSILFAVAIFKKDNNIFKYAFVLSVIGAIIALFHYISQISKQAIIACEALGYSASCSQTFVLTYGYITIPMMALTAFALIIVLSIMNFSKK